MVVSTAKIHPFGIAVTNLEKSKQFYRALGFELAMTSAFFYEGAEGELAVLKNGDISIELYQLPASALAQENTSQSEFVNHIAFAVADIDQTFRLLTEQGYATVEDAPVLLPFSRCTYKYFTLFGPNAEHLEFNQFIP